MQTIPLKIVGVGRYLPARVVPNAEVEARCGLRAGWIERKTGVRERRWVVHETSSQMAAWAAEEALADAGMKAGEIDLILNASGTPEQVIPDTGALIQRELGLGNSGIPSFTIHATCLSFLMALDVAANYLALGRYQRILIACADIASCALNFKEPESSVLFGDAAGACVVTRTPPGEDSALLAAYFATYGEGASLTELRGGGSRRHPNNPLTRPADALFHMEGPRVYRMARQYAN
ncbi:MAG: ketoacyl-ACP synthase III, partial [Candidatus Hydrogenedentes bacterium]|nr:ketoacyl-ACP synthase III [Candidatus Hydrogenedentota bacterium]